jgi:hypothetical protein
MSKWQPVLPATCVCMALEQRVAFIFFKIVKNNTKGEYFMARENYVKFKLRVSK